MKINTTKEQKRLLNNYIHIFYIDLFEIYLFEYMPNWKKDIQSNKIIELEYLIFQYKNECDHINLEKLHTYISDFDSLSKKIVNLLKDRTSNSILIERFSLINKLKYH